MYKSSAPAKKMKNLSAVVAAMLLAVTFLVGAALPSGAAVSTPSSSASVVMASAQLSHTVASKPQVATFRGAVPAAWGGATVCLGGAANMYVAAFMLGYCPTWIALQSPWGRSFMNWVVNSACKSPWIVRAATGGRYSRC